MLSSVWPMVASEALHGGLARSLPLTAASLAASIMGLEPLVPGGTVAGVEEGKELRVEVLEDTVAVVGAGVAGLLVARRLRGLGVRAVVFENSGRVGGFYRFFRGMDPGLDKVLEEAKDIPIVKASYIGFYDEGHAFLAGDTLYVTRGPVIYAGGGETPPPVTVNNDLPGIVSASYGLEIVSELGYRPRRAVVLGYGYWAPRVADKLAETGVETRLVAPRGGLAGEPEKAELVEADTVEGFLGVERVEGLVLGGGEEIATDMVLSALGEYPDANPVYAAGYRPVFLARCWRFAPEAPEPGTPMEAVGGLVPAGSVLGYEDLEAVKASAEYAAVLAARWLGAAGEADAEHYYGLLREALASAEKGCATASRPPVWLSGRVEGLQFVDMDEDILLYHAYSAFTKGYQVMELLKRSTGLGTGSDQGRFSAASTAMILAAISGRDPLSIGVFRARPPHSAPSLDLLARIPLEW
ncbi:hypothetical protein PYJP_07240 [Pyrofollis japonicus]|nr:hypothetical protein PYJP_07240 [Pyrofollis japonicus]